MTRSLTELPDQAPDDIPGYPMPRAGQCPLDPPPKLHELQGSGPLAKVRLWDGSTPWLATRHADQRALLGDSRISADPMNDGYPRNKLSLMSRGSSSTSFLTMDDPEHARFRRMVTASFTVRRIEGMRADIQAIVDQLIDEMLAGPSPADLVAAFALPVPSLVICRLLGVPYADHEFFQRASSTFVSPTASPQDLQAARDELLDYLDGLIARKIADPADDLLSKVAAEQVATGGMTRRELAVMGLLLLSAGHETTSNMIALGTYALLTHPDQLAIVRDSDDPQLIARTVEELLRFLTIVHSGRRRVALADIEIAGQVIKAGEGVIIPNDIANRDAAVFQDPDTLDVRRDARQHIAFGFGVHQCLGQPLARAELQIVYATLYRRVPTLALAASPATIPFKYDGMMFGVYELPVTW